MQLPLGEHPDGDPFAEQDAQREANSVLGRMEARAKAEAAALEAGVDSNGATLASNKRAAPPPPVRTSGRRSARNSAAAAANTAPTSAPPSASKKAKDIAAVPAMTIDYSDEDLTAAAAAMMPVTTTQESGASAVAAAAANGRKHAHESLTPGKQAASDDIAMEVDEPQAQHSPAPVTATGIEAAPASKGERKIPMLDLSAQDSSTPLTSTASTPVEVSAPVMATLTAPSATITAGEPLKIHVNMPPPPVPSTSAHGLAKPPAAEKTDPPLPVPKPVLRTIRLDIELARAGTTAAGHVPMFNVNERAKAAGYKSEEEDETKDDEDEDSGAGDDDEDGDGGESESDGEGGRRKKAQKPEGESGNRKENESKDGQPPAKRRKRGPNVVLGRHGGYDVEDPFVDDSEADLYEPKYYVRPLRKGFFVCTGELELEQSKKRGRVAGTKNKPKFDAHGNPVATMTMKRGKSSNNNTPAPETSITTFTPSYSRGVDEELPTVSSLPAFGSTGPLASAAPLNAAPATHSAPAKRDGGFSPELKRELEMLERETAKESFEVKNKFPPRLRPILLSVALKALELDEYDDAFFNVLPTILPYNHYTLKKLVKREIFPHRIASIEARIDERIEILRRMVLDVLPQQKRDFEALHQQWERDRADWEREQATKQNGAGDSRSTPPLMGPPSSVIGNVAALAGTPNSPSGVSSPGPGGAAASGKDDEDSGPIEPKWKFKMSEPMRLEVLAMCEYDDQITSLNVEKQELEKAAEKGEKPYSTLSARKELYAKMILKIWEPNDMTSNQLSREMSAIKNKLKKKAEAP